MTICFLVSISRGNLYFLYHKVEIDLFSSLFHSIVTKFGTFLNKDPRFLLVDGISSMTHEMSFMTHSHYYGKILGKANRERWMNYG